MRASAGWIGRCIGRCRSENVIEQGEPCMVASALSDPRAMDALCVNTIRTLAIDAIQQANSGHPGTPMGMAPTVYALWQRVLRFDPQDPIWPNRDRFVLSLARELVLAFVNATFSGEERHRRRLAKVRAFEEALWR